MKIKDILRVKGNDVITIGPDETVQEAIRKLNEYGIGALVVTGEREEISGIITERDILRECDERCVFLSQREQTNRPSLVRDVMKRDLIVGVPDDGLDYVRKHVTAAVQSLIFRFILSLTMKTLLLHHDDCLKHDPGTRHPEAPSRVRTILSAIRSMKGTEILPAPKASLEQIGRVHDTEYWQRLIELEPGADSDGVDKVALDPDTFLSPGSIDAALRGSGAACFAIDQVFAGKSRNAFCVIRPPGHHAQSGRAMGFCLLNHVAVAARHALAMHGIKRVSILDFDVHHGNGTQAIFEQAPEVLYVSSHQVPLSPGTGLADETG
ncbi:MAG: CBS domain-containing protein, partial [Lysobacterales bacterium]